MKVTIEKEVENALLERKEITATITEITQTPSREGVLKQIAAITGATVERVSIEKIHQEFGKKYVTVYAKIYKTKEIKEKIEPKYLVKRATKEKKVEEKPVVEKKEKPTEEKKKETPKEENKPEPEKKEVGEK